MHEARFIAHKRYLAWRRRVLPVAAVLLFLVVAIGWSVFHMRLNRRRAPQPAPESARLLLVVPRPKRAPDNDTTPSRPAA